MPTEIFSQEIDYENRVLNASTSIYRTISPQASGNITLSQSSSVGPSEFSIPSSVMNLSKSRLNFSISHALLANKSSWVNANALTMINRIVLYDVSTNSVWTDCGNFNQYASLTSTVGTKLDEFLTKGYSAGLPTTTTALSLTQVTEDITKTDDIDNFTADMAGTVSNLGDENNYVGRRQKYIGVAGEALALSFSIPFSAFKFTSLALNKQLYNPSNMVLQVYWNSTDSFGFQTNAVNTLAGPVSLPATTISNLSVSLCNEGNLLIVQQVIDTTMKQGLSLPIAYPTCTRQTISESASHAYQIQLTRGFGQRILAILTAPFSAVNNLTVQNIHGRGDISTYNTYINNVALKYPNGFNCLVGSEDFYIGNREQLKTSALQTLGEYVNAEWVHSDGFTGDKPLCELDQTIISGLDVSNQSSTWQIQANMSAAVAYIWITAIIGQKILTISNSGSVVV